MAILATLAAPSRAVAGAEDVANEDGLAVGETFRFSGVGLLGADGAFGLETLVGNVNGRSWAMTATHALSAGGIGDDAMLTPERPAQADRLAGIDSIPEPASGVVLGVAALACLRRKRRTLRASTKARHPADARGARGISIAHVGEETRPGS